MIKENFIYVGIDLHKETHTVVMLDCCNNKLGEITLLNRPADFLKLAGKIKVIIMAQPRKGKGREQASHR